MAVSSHKSAIHLARCLSMAAVFGALCGPVRAQVASGDVVPMPPMVPGAAVANAPANSMVPMPPVASPADAAKSLGAIPALPFADNAFDDSLPTPSLPPAPVAPSMDPLGAVPTISAGEVFDPNKPVQVTPVTPMAPAQIPSADAKKTGEITSLPKPKTEEEFKFFQPGYQWRDPDEGKNKKADDDKDKGPVGPVPQQEKKKKIYYVDQFNYRNQRLPLKIYMKQYTPENAHLPKAQFETDYDAYTFAAAANNDLHTLRAMIASGRSVHMVNGFGETLLTVASRNSAHETVRYLLTKGVNPGTADTLRADYQTRIALESVR